MRPHSRPSGDSSRGHGRKDQGRGRSPRGHADHRPHRRAPVRRHGRGAAPAGGLCQGRRRHSLPRSDGKRGGDANRLRDFRQAGHGQHGEWRVDADPEARCAERHRLCLCHLPLPLQPDRSLRHRGGVHQAQGAG